MALKPAPFIGGHFRGRSPNASDQRTINFYPEINKETESQIILMGTPGLKVWEDLVKGPVRGKKVANSLLYVVAGNLVYTIDAGKVVTLLSGSLLTSSGHVFIEANSSGQVMIVEKDAAKGYCVEAGVVSLIGDADFVDPTSLTCQDGYGIVTERNSGRFWISWINDFTAWSALDYSTAETLPDNVISCLSDHRELWMFGEESTEVYRNTGNSDFPFERIDGAYQEVGIGGPASAAKVDNSIFFIDNGGLVRRIDGYTPVIVSTPQIAYEMSLCDNISDAFGMSYSHQGHMFYLLTFPGYGTWCFDAATGLWHKRSSYPNAPESRWRGNCHAFFAGLNLFGDYENGKIYELDYERYEDDGHELPAVRRGQEITASQRNMFINEFNLSIQAGVGFETGQGSDPVIMLRCSKDGGHTWGPERWQSMGKIGQYDKRVSWTRLGMARTWIPEITITDPVNRTIIGAYIDVEGGR